MASPLYLPPLFRGGRRIKTPIYLLTSALPETTAAAIDEIGSREPTAPALGSDSSENVAATLVKGFPKSRPKIRRKAVHHPTAVGRSPAQTHEQLTTDGANGDNNNNLSQFEDQSNENPTKERSQQQETSPTTADGSLFACPFYKYDLETYRDCRRHQLKRVKDVKQHLMRRHRQIHCIRCYQVFGSQSLLESHLRSGDDPCEVRPNPPPGFVSSEQWDQLRGQYTSRGKPVEQQWMDVWDILFPTVPRPRSPYEGDFMGECLSQLRNFWRTQHATIINEIKGGLWVSSSSEACIIMQQEERPMLCSRCANHNPQHAEFHVFDLLIERLLGQFEKRGGEAPPPGTGDAKTEDEIMISTPSSKIIPELVSPSSAAAAAAEPPNSDWLLPIDFDFDFEFFAQPWESDSGTIYPDSTPHLSTESLPRSARGASRSQDSIGRGERGEVSPSIIPTRSHGGIADRVARAKPTKLGDATSTAYATGTVTEIYSVGGGEPFDCFGVDTAVLNLFSSSEVPASRSIDDIL